MIRPEFPTPEMRAAEQKLSAHISAGLARGHDLQDTLDRLEKEEREAAKNAPATEPEPVPLPTGEQLQTMITKHAMTPEWRPVIERIDQGKLSWDEVLSSFRSGTVDGEVKAALQSLATVPMPTDEEMVALGLKEPPEESPDRRR